MVHPVSGVALAAIVTRLALDQVDGVSVALGAAAVAIVSFHAWHRSRIVFLEFAGRGFLHVASGHASARRMKAVAPELDLSSWGALLHIGEREGQLLLMTEHARMSDNQYVTLESVELELETGYGGWVTAATLRSGDERVAIRLRSAAKRTG